VVVQQVDLVDIEDAPVGGGEQPRLEGLDPLRERTLQVEGADDAVLGGTDGQLEQAGSGAAGSQAKRQPGTTSTGGRTAASARTVVDLAVPFSPRTSTPPMAGETAFSRSASRMSPMPTTAPNG
jgi:hypothetical protein